MPYGSLAIDKLTASTGQVFSPASSIMRNRIINGGMVIDQRNAGASVTPNGTYTLDRWATENSVTSKFTVQQNAGSVTPPVGFTKYLGVTSSSSYSSGASDYFDVCQRIEGYNIADLGWGTANAKTVTLSFQVYSSLTGTFSGALQNSNASRSYPFTYAVSSANTWTSISVTIAGDTSGTWLSTNGVGIQVCFDLGSGTSLRGTAGSWSGNWYIGATGAVSVVGTSGATFYITGVQLEAGTVASQFEYRQYGTELALCQRYFEKSIADGTAANAIVNTAPTLIGCAYSSTTVRTQIFYKVSKRVTGTITRVPSSTGGTGSQWAWYNGGWNVGNTSVSQSNPNAFSVDVTVSGLTAFQSTLIDANWYTDAEL